MKNSNENIRSDELSPSEYWDEDATKRAIDELFTYTRQFRSTKQYVNLLKFVGSFRFYSPYNAMLIYMQMPGARYVAPAHRWLKDFGRIIKPEARPLVILQPMGPVMFVFDVSDTIPGKDAIPLPPDVENPFEVGSGFIGMELEKTIFNAQRDGIKIVYRKEGSQSAGSIRLVNKQDYPHMSFPSGKDSDGNPTYDQIPVHYYMLVNENLSSESQYTTTVHELGHLYCGHLGTPNEKWWPDRRGLGLESKEFEAESVTYLITQRLGIDSKSPEYLSGYTQEDNTIPSISFECVMKATGLIEQMGRQRLKKRKIK